MHHATGTYITLAVIAGIAALLVWNDQPLKDRPRIADLNIKAGMDGKTLPAPDWIAKSVKLVPRIDVRREGFKLKHQVLAMTSVARPSARLRPAGATLVFTDASDLEDRVNDVLDGTVPVNPGTKATFALDRLAVVTLVKLDATGTVATVEEVRVSFVEFTHNTLVAQH